MISRNLNKIVEIKSKVDFQNYCVKRGQTCIIALINGDKVISIELIL